jgi:hypothetical protein
MVVGNQGKDKYIPLFLQALSFYSVKIFILVFNKSLKTFDYLYPFIKFVAAQWGHDVYKRSPYECN